MKDIGKLRHQPSHLIDIMATCVDVAKATYPATYKGNQITPLAGESLMSVFDQNNTTRNPIFFEHEGNRAVRNGKWKLISKAYPDKPAFFMHMDTIPTDQWELFNMEVDRSEMVNVANENPGLVKELAELWYQWAKRTYTIPKPNRIGKQKGARIKIQPRVLNPISYEKPMS